MRTLSIFILSISLSIYAAGARCCFSCSSYRPQSLYLFARFRLFGRLNYLGRHTTVPTLTYCFANSCLPRALTHFVYTNRLALTLSFAPTTETVKKQQKYDTLAEIITLKWIKVGYSLKSHRIVSHSLHYIIHYTLCTPPSPASHHHFAYTYFQFSICSFISLDFLTFVFVIFFLLLLFICCCRFFFFFFVDFHFYFSVDVCALLGVYFFFFTSFILIASICALSSAISRFSAGKCER